jgi:hypothetical protein
MALHKINNYYIPSLVFLVKIWQGCSPCQGQIEIRHSSFSNSFSGFPGDQNAVCRKIYSQIYPLGQMYNYLEAEMYSTEIHIHELLEINAS